MGHFESTAQEAASLSSRRVTEMVLESDVAILSASGVAEAEKLDFSRRHNGMTEGAIWDLPMSAASTLRRESSALRRESSAETILVEGYQVSASKLEAADIPQGSTSLSRASTSTPVSGTGTQE